MEFGFVSKRDFWFSKLGNNYVQYMKRTKRLIPFIL